MNSRTVSLARWAITLSLPFFLVLSVVFLFMTEAFVRYEYSRPDFPPSERFSPTDRYHFAVESLLYVAGQRTSEQFKNLGVYNEREISHMVDVRNVVDSVRWVEWLSGLALAAGLVYLLRNRSTRRDAFGALQAGALLTVIMLAVIGLFSVTSFDTFFVAFHRLFFKGDSWLFLTTDSLIQYYPEPLWQDAAAGIALFTIIGALIVGGVAWWLARRATAPPARTVSARV